MSLMVEGKASKMKFLAQGTLYTDVIEARAQIMLKTIASHHNVGGLPEDMQFELIELLNTLYKDEVRALVLNLACQTISYGANHSQDQGLPSVSW